MQLHRDHHQFLNIPVILQFRQVKSINLPSPNTQYDIQNLKKNLFFLTDGCVPGEGLPHNKEMGVTELAGRVRLSKVCSTKSSASDH